MNRVACLALCVAAGTGCGSSDPVSFPADAGDEAAADAGADTAPPADATVDATGGGSDTGSDSPADVAIDSAACASGAAPVTETVVDVDDALLASGTPNLHFTPTTIIAVQNQLVGLFRFTLSATAVTALKNQRALSLTATFTRAVSDKANCGSPPSYTCQTSAGVFTAYPVKVTWDAAAVSWTVRSAGVNWAVAGAQGTADIGPEAWHANIGAGDPAMVMQLAPAAFDSSTVQADNSITVRASSENGAFVIASRNNATYAHPTLAIRYCP